MLITQNKKWQRGTRKRTIRKELKLGPMSVKFVTIALMAIVGCFYLSQSAQASSQKYQIMQATSQKQELESKTKDLEVEAARLKSLTEIKKTAQNDDFEPIGTNLIYLDGLK